jgi:hypothetical protein
MADHTEERDALELVALLRRSVHGEPFTPIGRRVAGQSINLIELPAEDTPPFLAAVGRRRDAAWGIHPIATTAGGIRIEADTYVEALLPAVARSLNALMRTTELKRFPGVPPGWVAPPWPSADAEEPEIRAAVRLLAALPELAQTATPWRSLGDP